MSFGFGEILLVMVLVLVLFGAGKLPSVMGDLAKGVKNFKKGLHEEDEVANPAPAKAVDDKAKTPEA